MSSSFITRSPSVEEAGSWSSPKAPPSRQSEAARSCGCVPTSIANRPSRPPGWRSSHFGRRAVTTWEGAASERYCGGMSDGKVETLRAVIEAVNRRDLDALSKLLAPDGDYRNSRFINGLRDVRGEVEVGHPSYTAPLPER